MVLWHALSSKSHDDAATGQRRLSDGHGWACDDFDASITNPGTKSTPWSRRPRAERNGVLLRSDATTNTTQLSPADDEHEHEYDAPRTRLFLSPVSQSTDVLPIVWRL